MGVNLFTDLCNKMLAGQMQSPLWLEYCINERTSYLAQVIEFSLIQDSLVLMDEIIDNAILRAGGLPLASPDSLTRLTTFTLLCSLPCDLGGLSIRRFGGLAGETACLGAHSLLRVRRKGHSSASGRWLLPP